MPELFRFEIAFFTASLSLIAVLWQLSGNEKMSWLFKSAFLTVGVIVIPVIGTWLAHLCSTNEIIALSPNKYFILFHYLSLLAILTIPYVVFFFMVINADEVKLHYRPN